ncbi:polysaccharide pyruvyl transferase family protein [Vibrio sp. EJY3]|uniref:polysaccharide pyruvyl transferase family protein n=1 Tax=Vibrio sp. (strain EJY3) TaxID=1116375 RepID=UPI000243A587|nr:polysaccharide pyruvyl transferase family protein [Vibrio sp. EJY3]AEX20703.1 polysaccharide pyruvyl transferase [Vibrio sp. EJY3]
MKIVLSGGWGYGNLGDDVILNSQLHILNEMFPNAVFTVLTYDVKDSVSHSGKNIKLEENIHKKCDFNSSKIRFMGLGDAYPYSSRFKDRVINRVIDEKSIFEYFVKKNSNLDEFRKVISGSDIFIMCGGGYFNEKWKSKIYSQLKELEIAINEGLKVYILGPTIGKLENKIAIDTKLMFEKAEIITVRDKASKKELEKLGLKAEIVPDVALSKWVTNIRQESKYLGVVFTSKKSEVMENVVSLIKLYQNKGRSYKVKLFLSRLWNNDFLMLKNLQEVLKENNISSDIIIPSDHINLEQQLITCDLVISENLHGMITAARNGVRIIAINDYQLNSPNYKKIVSFLEQINISNDFISSSTTQNDINNIVERIEDNQKEYEKGIKSVRENTKESYLRVFNGFKK